MGTDIYGWIEIRFVEEEEWSAVVDASILLEREYQMFGSLFGVRNRSSLTPIAPNRGLPTDASEMVQKVGTGGGCHSHTWLTWTEVEAVDWAETTQEVFGLATTENLHGHDKWHSVVFIPDKHSHKQEGLTWEENGFQYTARRVTRWEMLGGDCQALFDWMRLLGKKYGGEAVRQVVTFSS